MNPHPAVDFQRPPNIPLLAAAVFLLIGSGIFLL